MKKTTLILAALVGFTGLTGSAFASDAARQEAERVIALKDGSTLYIFKDQKMAMEDRVGRAVRMASGHVMETPDGQRITMVGDEVARLDWLLHAEHRN